MRLRLQRALVHGFILFPESRVVVVLLLLLLLLLSPLTDGETEARKVHSRDLNTNLGSTF